MLHLSDRDVAVTYWLSSDVFLCIGLLQSVSPSCVLEGCSIKCQLVTVNT